MRNGFFELNNDMSVEMPAGGQSAGISRLGFVPHFMW